ncbi:MAG: dockerin type I repeat-containing protein [Patescibacteria group bacterium]|nr:dockerin type I repeat-containing protein [Patescibacteria group bacterium]
MTKKTLFRAGITALSLGVALSLGTTLVWAVNNGNTNSGNKNANTNMSQPVTYPAQKGGTVLAGDANGNGVVGGPANYSETLADVQTLLRSQYCTRCTVGKNPTLTLGCLRAANVNGDGAVNVTDAIYLINYAFAGGSAPVRSPSTLTCVQAAPLPAPSPSPTPRPSPSPSPR